MLILFLAALLCVFASAEEETKPAIQIVDSTGEAVSAYEFDPLAEDFDARTVIQRAILVAKKTASEENPLTLIVPAGEYSISSAINVFSNMTIDFSDSVLTRTEGCQSSYMRFGSSDSETSGYDGYKNITIKNAVLDDKGLAHNSSYIRFAHAQNILIENVRMQNSVGVTHLLTFAASKDVTVKKCVFLNMDVSSISASQNCEAIQIDILKESYFSKYALYDGTPTENVVVSGCRFENVPRGCGTHSAIAGHYFRNIIFTKNTFKNVTGYAIKTLNYRNSKVTYNKIVNCGSGISVSDITSSRLQNCYAPLSEETVLEKESNMTISKNTISVCDTSYSSRAYAYGIEVFGAVVKNATDKDGKEYSGDFRMRNVSISGNSITSTVSKKDFHAIEVSGAYSSTAGSSSGIKITGNSFSQTVKKGSSQTVNAMRIEKSTNVYISKNTVAEGSQKLSTLLLLDDCKGSHVCENSFLTGGTNAVLLRGSSGSTISKNKFSKTSSHSIYAYSKSSKSTVEGNTISYPSKSAVAVNSCSGASIKGNIIKSAKGSGIYVTGSTSVSVTGNKLTSCLNGIYVKSSSGKYISKNTIEKPKEKGIYLNGSSSYTSISQNYICAPVKTGIYLVDSAFCDTMSGNQIDLTSKTINAIYIREKAGVSKLTSNKINCKTDPASKKLKVACNVGIYINSSAAKTTQLNSNVFANCQTAIKYNKLARKATVKSNKFSKCATEIKAG